MDSAKHYVIHGSMSMIEGVTKEEFEEAFPVPVAKGGTGATTAKDARANLGLSDSSGNIPVTSGGTGASTAAAARTNLGAAASSHNHAASDINSGTFSSDRLPTVPIAKGGTGATTAAGARNALGLGNTSGAVPVANGGTGATSAAAARTNLGAAAASHTHSASDVTSGSLSSDRLPTVPIAKGGTGATTAANARTNLGIADYITEQGTSGSYYYRKWASGVSEFWGYYAVSSVACTTAAGSMYVTASINPNKSYPSNLFASNKIDSVQMTFTSNSGTPAIVYCDDGFLTTGKLPSFKLMRHASATITGYMHYHVIGRWK